MANKTEISPKEVFEIFDTYWDGTEKWKDVSRAKVAYILKDYYTEIPEESVLQNPKTGKEFYKAVKEALTVEPSKHLTLKEKRSLAK